ncbi:MAG: putative Ig domain-containing protein, partial [Synergistaceae bacterium]|nr:putative Ig domain-containing protein [Synergistaceae bacterium]MBR2209319.1 putative Ig domain-containing protein [Synergistaceae bacterium]
DIGAVEIDVPTLAVNFTDAPETLTVKQGETGTATFKAAGTATYIDDPQENLVPTLENSDEWPNWITFDAATGVVTAKPTSTTDAGNYSVKVKATATLFEISKSSEPATLTITVTKANNDNPGGDDNPDDDDPGNDALDDDDKPSGDDDNGDDNDDDNPSGDDSGDDDDDSKKDDSSDSQEDNSSSGKKGTDDFYFETVSETVKKIIEGKYRQILQNLPDGVEFFTTLENVTIPEGLDLKAFIISIKAKLNGTLLEIVAELSPIQVSEPGVYLMKLVISDEQREYLKGCRNLTYHVAPYYDFVKDTQNSAFTADASDSIKASDGSNGYLVDDNGNVLSGDYDGRDFNILVYLAQANVPYVQFLTMEADANDSIHHGCGSGCNSGFLAVTAILPLAIFIKNRKKK